MDYFQLIKLNFVKIILFILDLLQLLIHMFQMVKFIFNFLIEKILDLL